MSKQLFLENLMFNLIFVYGLDVKIIKENIEEEIELIMSLESLYKTDYFETFIVNINCK